MFNLDDETKLKIMDAGQVITIIYVVVLFIAGLSIAGYMMIATW